MRICLEDVLGGGVHGLAAADDPVGPQIKEHLGQARSGGHRHKAVLLLRRGGGGVPLLHGLQLGLYGLQIVGGLGLLAGGQLVPLGAHVLDLGQLQGAVLLGLGEGQARVVGVDVDLKLLVPLSDDQAVADGLQPSPVLLQGLAPVRRTMNTVS